MLYPVVNFVNERRAAGCNRWRPLTARLARIGALKLQLPLRNREDIPMLRLQNLKTLDLTILEVEQTHKGAELPFCCISVQSRIQRRNRTLGHSDVSTEPRPNNILCSSLKDLLQLRCLTRIPFHGKPNACFGQIVQEHNVSVPRV